jgi:16S rRNA (guanine(966)-N(2))-methyltransferase RsmD
MRIISGQFRGRRVQAPTNLPVRPTTDMAKEGLFNYIGARLEIQGIHALDLFCGTGNISYELISRGAASITAVDKHPACCKFVSTYANQLKPGIVKVYNTDSLVAIERSREQFELIFADPPYDYTRYADLVQGVLTGNLLHPDGLFVVEHASNIDFTLIPGYIETRHYGKVHFSFFHSIHTNQA